MRFVSYGFGERGYYQAEEIRTGIYHAFRGVYDETTMRYVILCTGKIGTKSLKTANPEYRFWNIRFIDLPSGESCSQCIKKSREV